MKRVLSVFFGLYLFISLSASELVLIKTAGPDELTSLSNNPHLTINYLGNGFVIATRTGDIKQEFILVDKNAWQENENYFLVYHGAYSDGSYSEEMNNVGEILYQNKENSVISVTSQDLGNVVPPQYGSLARITNKIVKLPSNSISFPQVKADPDPFIVARMAEVNTTLIQTNLQHLQDYGTRNAYTSQSILAQNWIKAQFESYGLTATLFDFTMPSGPASDNVIATKTGTLYPDEYVVIGGHYDSYSSSGNAPGADDNASGTCGVLEIARILAPHDLDRSIIFCAFSGEEYGLYGSEAYATWCDNQNLNILGYLNMDMVGYLNPGDPIHTDIIAPASALSLETYYISIVNLYLPGFTATHGSLSGGDSDHTSFNEHGYMGIFPFEDSENYSPYIHTSSDLIGNSVNSFEQVGIFTKAILATAVSMANMITPPKNLIAIPGNGFITLTWDAMTGANSYNIYKNGNPVPFGNSLTTTFVDDDVSISGTYNYYVTAVFTDTGDESDPSNQVTQTLLAPMAFPFVEDFETGTLRWKLDSPWALMTGTYHSATHSLTESPSGNYTNNLNVSAYLYPFSLKTATSANFSFWTRYVTESGYDYLYVEISTNGNNWNQLASYNGSATTWSQKSFNLSAYLGQPYVCIRFRFYSDVYITAAGVNIDDINLNVTSPSSFSINLTALMEGPFNGSTMNTGLNGILPLSQPFNPELPYFGNLMPDWYYTGSESVTTIPNSNIVDWILVELRDAWNADGAVKATIIATKPAFILNNGSVVDLDGSSGIQYTGTVYNNLYPVIYHRNHLTVMSGAQAAYSAGTFTYNFTTGEEQAYGGSSAHKELAPGIWGLRTGDGNADGMVTDADKDALWDIQASQSGYLPSDYNLDGQSDNLDKNDWWLPSYGSGSSIPD
jgi:hypothetical protein